VQFALLETVPAATASLDSALELVLKNRERLRIGNPVIAAIFPNWTPRVRIPSPASCFQ
jgi:hypothetical protein